MPKFHKSVSFAMALAPVSVVAEPLQIVTDIAPVQSLVQMVAGDLAEVKVILRPGASPHGYAMRPSDAKALQAADIVVWVGHGLTPWLESAIETLANDAKVLELANLEGGLVLPVREDARFESHAHHDDHDDGDHADHEEADHDEEHHDDAEHDDRDPHLWLSPVNADLWIDAIADLMADVKPDLSTELETNAASAHAVIQQTTTEVMTTLDGLTDRPFVVYHDAYQYFETAFGLSAAGSLALSDAAPPSASRISEIRDLVEESNVVCAFSEPQFDPGLVDAVFGARADVKVAVLDPIGFGLSPGPDLYPDLLQSLAETAADCLN